MDEPTRFHEGGGTARLGRGGEDGSAASSRTRTTPPSLTGREGLASPGPSPSVGADPSNGSSNSNGTPGRSNTMCSSHMAIPHTTSASSPGERCRLGSLPTRGESPWRGGMGDHRESGGAAPLQSSPPPPPLSARGGVPGEERGKSASRKKSVKASRRRAAYSAWSRMAQTVPASPSG